MFTQPIMYKKIAEHPNTRQVYGEQLVREGAFTEAEAQQRVDGFREKLEKDFEASSSYKPNKADWLEGKWQGTMALTEPEAGSSLSDITTTAEPTGEDYYTIKSQKIFNEKKIHDHSQFTNIDFYYY